MATWIKVVLTIYFWIEWSEYLRIAVEFKETGKVFRLDPTYEGVTLALIFSIFITWAIWRKP